MLRAVQCMLSSSQYGRKLKLDHARDYAWDRGDTNTEHRGLYSTVRSYAEHFEPTLSVHFDSTSAVRNGGTDVDPGNHPAFLAIQHAAHMQFRALPAEVWSCDILPNSLCSLSASQLDASPVQPCQATLQCYAYNSERLRSFLMKTTGACKLQHHRPCSAHKRGIANNPSTDIATPLRRTMQAHG